MCSTRIGLRLAVTDPHNAPVARKAFGWNACDLLSLDVQGDGYYLDRSGFGYGASRDWYGRALSRNGTRRARYAR